MRPSLRPLAVLALALLAACAHPAVRGPAPEERPGRAGREEPVEARPEAPAAPPPAASPPSSPRAQEGLASFYARSLHGRRTASGARYDEHALTCAHRTLPFGTRVRVTALEDGRSVVVTVNDRGPFVKGRVVDLSRAAARRLGMLGAGVARVRVEIVAEATAER
ncbi:MAG: septal ring lytic transglycosylase RlpA family protein [Anaeromyxobacteraceae bacterium]